MFDPRDDTRDRDGREDGRARVYDERVGQAQQVLRRLVNGKLVFTPNKAGFYEFSGRGTVRPLLAGVVRMLASPTGFEPVFWP